ncbi:MAG: PleD family two-component system response regulator, partial [bacterium]
MDNPNILVIDGDPKNLQILKESLESSDFRVMTTNNGAEAWSIIQAHKPDIVISEVDIPGLDGFKLFKKMQNDPVGASIPVVFLTNRRSLEDRLQSLRSGVKDYMIKPLHQTRAEEFPRARVIWN